MAKQTKAENGNNKPKATEAIVSITETVLAFRNGGKPSLAQIARIAGRASSLLHLADLDEKISVENAATIAVAKKHSLPITE
jgi:hypothetical protein